MHKVRVHSHNQITDFEVSDRQSLLSHMRKYGIPVEAPCNGNGTCGKCSVRVISGNLPQPSADEIRLLGEQAIASGFRLACRLSVESDMELAVTEADISGAKILTEGNQHSIAIKPIVSKAFVQLDKPELEDQTADLERIKGLPDSPEAVSLEIIRELPGTLREKDFGITLLKNGTVLLKVEAGNTTHSLYGAAIDIGTTTLACYLIDLHTGKRLSVNSLLNPQKIYGADVISRIQHTIDSSSGLQELHGLIINAINASIAVLCSQSGIKPENIYALSLVGNTTMTHLLLNVSPRNIALAPFVPAFTSKMLLQAKSLDISINSSGLVCILPSVSAYIGADTVAAVLSSGLFRQKNMSLLIDIGTNGEIVLGSETGMFACSSAAGPAFEGANIRNGMGGITGAISSLSLTQGLSYKTIGNSKPIGICGTGIVDALAQLLEVGIVDETGRVNTGWEAAVPAQAELADRITTVDGMNAFVICRGEETLSGREIVLTQKDIRELQNAKAAVAAGINVLVREAGITFEDISEVYLAGGFGSYINIDSALKIGLIPSALAGKISTVGNAAGQGAVEALINEDYLKLSEEISRKIKYIELSASKDFNDYYVDCMLFDA